MPTPLKVNRAAKATRERIVKAAARAFAAYGFEGTSIRQIVTRADVNQAAINYHFGSKEGLYRAVLQMALVAMTKAEKTEAAESGAETREAALRRFVRQQLRPMTARDDRSDYLRIFGWETLRPSAPFRRFMAEEAAPFFAEAAALVRRFSAPGRKRTAGGDRFTLALWPMQHLRAQPRATR